MYLVECELIERKREKLIQRRAAIRIKLGLSLNIT